MIAISYTEHGPPETVLRTTDESSMTPGPGEVRVRLAASPITSTELLSVRGLYPLLPPLPAHPGMEGSATIDALGTEVDGLAVGTPVLLPVRSGCWRETLVLPANDLEVLPAGIDLQQASLLWITFPTAELLLSEFAELNPGDWVLQSPGAGSVGQAVVQIAAERGLKTVSVVRREERVAAVKALGGDAVVVEGERLGRRIREVTGGAPIRLALDGVGGPGTARLARCLAPGSDVVVYGGMARAPATLGIGEAIFRGVSVRGFWLYAWNRSVGTARARTVRARAAARVHAGMHVGIDSCFPLTELAAALARNRSPERAGRVLLTSTG